MNHLTTKMYKLVAMSDDCTKVIGTFIFLYF